MTTIIIDNADLHNALNAFIQKKFGTSLVLKEYKVKYLKGKSGGDYKVELKVESKEGGEA
jgi:alpha-L-arabinofuranosidase